MLEKLFQIKEQGSSFKKELLAAVTTFLTVSYIVIVNPSILKETGMPFEGVLTATILVSFLSSVMMGLWANLPYALAPGMGVNAFFTFTLVASGVKWETALGATFLAGVIFMALSAFRLRETFMKAMPSSIRYAVAAGIGIFLALIGLTSNLGTVDHKVSVLVHNPDTVIGFGFLTPVTILFFAGLLLTAILLAWRIKGAFVIGIVVTAIGAWTLSYFHMGPGGSAFAPWPEGIFAWPDFTSVFMKMDVLGALNYSVWWAVFTILFVDLFDSVPTFVGLAEAGGFIDARTGEPRRAGRALFVDAVGTTISGILGTSSVTTYLESATGIRAGGKTGLTAVLVGIMFLPFLFFSPLLGAIPTVATAPVLVLVGLFMVPTLTKIHWEDVEEGVPAFLAMVLIPLTYSINLGMSWAFIAYTVMKLFRGRIREIHPALWVVNLLAIANLVIQYWK